jgi:hypothetical protein
MLIFVSFDLENSFENLLPRLIEGDEIAVIIRVTRPPVHEPKNILQSAWFRGTADTRVCTSDIENRGSTHTQVP